jgi:hypothetical protein
MPDQDDQDLPQAARLAWRAYLAMRETKQAYFEFLQELDVKYRTGGAPTFAENLKLEELLTAHDSKVAAFSEAMRAMKDVDQSEREALLKRISEAAAGNDS